MKKLFPTYTSRASRILTYMSAAMVWPGCVATLFIHKGDTLAPYLMAWMAFGLLASLGALGSFANDSRKANR